MQRIISITLLLLLFTGCEIEKVKDGELPEVNIESGDLPKYDVRVADVDIGMREKTIKVPKVTVEMEETVVKVPYIDMDVPGEESDERTVTVEVEVEGEGHSIDIEEIYFKDNMFWVISRLDMNESAQTDATVRISDRVIINAPPAIDVKHYIIGDPPRGTHNDQFRFIHSKQDIAEDLSDAKRILG